MRHLLPILLAACAGQPDAPTLTYLAFGSSGSTVTVAWAPADGATSYTLERENASGEYAPIATLDPTVHGYLDTGLAPNTTYTYRFSITTPEGTTVEDPEPATTTDEDILVTGDMPPSGAPVAQAIGVGGGTITVAAVGATVTIPAGAVPDGTVVTVTPVQSPYASDPSFDPGEIGVAIESTMPFSGPVALAFALDDLDLLEPDNAVALVHRDDGSWVTRPRAIDTTARTATLAIDPTDAETAARELPNAPIRYHDAFVVRSTYVLPTNATVKVGKTLDLAPLGLFSDDPCDIPSTGDQYLCVAVTGVAIALGQVSRADFMRPSHREARVLTNTAPNYQRDWTVENAIGGTAAFGTIVPTGNTGARYTAPQAKPMPNPVAVRFTSVSLRPHHAAVPVPALITIEGPGSVLVQGKFHQSQSNLPCPGGAAAMDVDDGFTFQITLDAQLAYHIVSITNQVTNLSNIVLGPVETGIDFGTPPDEPEVFTLTGGTVVENATLHRLDITLQGTAHGGNCQVTLLDGSTQPDPGVTIPPMYGLSIDENMATTSTSLEWTFTATQN